MLLSKKKINVRSHPSLHPA